MRSITCFAAVTAMAVAFAFAPQWAKDTISSFKIMGMFFVVYMTAILYGAS